MSPPPSGRAHPAGRRRKLLLVGTLAAVVVAADQVTKTLAVDRLTDGPVHLIGPLSLDLAFNSGVAFSIATGLGVPIIVIGLVLVVSLVYFARSAPSYPVAVALGLILGGAVGNLSDRLFRHRGGAVVDFIQTGFWPTFNLADSAIVCGAVLLCICLVRDARRARDVPGTAP